MDKHCDDYINDETAPECLRTFLAHGRAPAHGSGLGPKPPLFATWKELDGPGGRKGKTRRVRVVMASRMGDVGITKNLDAEHGYDWRVSVSELTDFSSTAPQDLKETK